MAITDKRRTFSILPISLYAGGLVLVLLGQRMLVSSEALRWALSFLGLAGIVASAALRLLQSMKAEGERRTIERGLFAFSLLGLVAVLLGLTLTEAGAELLGLSQLETAQKARFDGFVSVAFVVLLLVSSLPLGFAETALFPMRHASRIESRRVIAASLAGLSLAFAASYGALFTYGAGELDQKADFSYFRTARPGESSRKIAASLEEPVKVLTFFPQLSETGLEVSRYLEELAKDAPNLHITHHDRVLSPAIARNNRIIQDGVIALRQRELGETIYIGTDLRDARSRLRTLDGDFQKALLKLIRDDKIAYFTVGHGELNETSQSPDRRVAHGLRQILSAQSFAVKDLGLADGLGTDVPDDATVVLVLGPRQPFLEAEIQALERYAKRGGHLLLALDPEADIDLSPLAAIAGLSWEPTILANDKVHVRRRFNDSDRTLLATHQYSAHASVTTLGRAGMRAPIVLPGASALSKLSDADADLHIDFAVRALTETFDDRNGNFRYDEGEETRKAYNLAAAVTRKVDSGDDKKEMRIFAIGDVDAFSDWALGNEPNALFAIDVLRWLGFEESFAGSIANTEDVRIEHTKQKDLVWFYSTILGVPSLVLGVGLFFTRRSRHRKGPNSPGQGKGSLPTSRDERKAA